MCEWTVEDEDILFQCRATYKQRAGTLFATNKRLAWYQTSASIPQISVPLEMLRGMPKANKAASERCMLKFVPRDAIKEQTEFTFEFSGASRAADRDGVAAVMQQLLGRAPRPAPAPLMPAAAPAQLAEQQAAVVAGESRAARAVREASAGLSGGDVRRRAAALAGDVALRELFEALVTPAIISEDEFWQHRAADLDKYRAAAASRVAGPPTELVTQLRPSAVRPGELHYRLTAAVIAQIFAEQPVVRRAYEASVPHRRSETEFWTEYLQSRYVDAAVAGRPRAGQAASASATVAGDIFAAAAAALELERRGAPAPPPSDVDVRPLDGETGGAEDAMEPAASHLSGNGIGIGAAGDGGGNAAAVEAVIARCNAHSAQVVAAATALPSRDAPGELADLLAAAQPAAAPLRLRGAPAGYTGRADDDDDDDDDELVLHGDDDDGGVAPMQTGEGSGERVTEETRALFCARVAAPPPRTAPAALWTRHGFVSPPSPAAAPEGVSAGGAVVPPSGVVLRAQELCRHYWACFPVTSVAALAKAKRMRDALMPLRGHADTSVAPMVQRALAHAASNL